jgi:hypothetical protein
MISDIDRGHTIIICLNISKITHMSHVHVVLGSTMRGTVWIVMRTGGQASWTRYVSVLMDVEAVILIWYKTPDLSEQSNIGTRHLHYSDVASDACARRLIRTRKNANSESI